MLLVMPKSGDPSRQDAEERFARLYDAHWRAVLGYALRRTPSTDDAAEVVGETFLVAWRRGNEVPGGAEARLWLFGVARRVLANQRRGERRATQLTERLKQELAARPAQLLTDPNPEIADTLCALRRLDESDRELLLLVGWEELRPKDAARVLGISPVATRSRLHRARRRLRQILEEDDRRSCEPCGSPTLGMEDA
jgi:RNA polymerase sigma-70 factor, ECF subfamily